MVSSGQPLLIDLDLLATDQWTPTLAAADAGLSGLQARVDTLALAIERLNVTAAGTGGAMQGAASGSTATAGGMAQAAAAGDVYITTLTEINAELMVYEGNSGRAAAASSSQAAGFAGMAEGAGMAALAVGALAVVAGEQDAKFEALMSKLESFAGQTHEQVQQYTDQIRELAAAAGEAPTKLAEGLYPIVSVGFQGADAMKILSESTYLAKAAQTDTLTVTNALTAAMKAYNLGADDASHVLDVLTATTTAGNLQFSDLAGSIGKVLEVSAASGVSLEEVGASMATMTQRGIPADQAAVALRGSLLALTAPTRQTKDELAALGVTVDDVRQSIRENGYLETLSELYDRTGGNESALRSLVPNVRALVGVIADVKDGTDSYGTSLDKTTNSVGLAQHAHEVYANTTQNNWNRLKASVLVDLGEMGEGVDTFAGPAMGKLADFFDALSSNEKFNGAFEGPFRDMMSFLQDDFEPGVMEVWRNITDPAVQGWDAVVSMVRGGVNDVIGVIDDFIGEINKLQIHTPDVGGHSIDWNGPGISPIPQLASGSAGFAGGLAVVGEQGAELVSLPAGAAVYSHPQSQALIAAAGMAGVPGFANGTYPSGSKGKIFNAQELAQGLLTAGMDPSLVPTMVAILLQEAGPLGEVNSWDAASIGQFTSPTWDDQRPAGMSVDDWRRMRTDTSAAGIQSQFQSIVKLQGSRGYMPWDPYRAVNPGDPRASQGHRDPTGEIIIGPGQGNYLDRMAEATQAVQTILAAQNASDSAAPTIDAPDATPDTPPPGAVQPGDVGAPSAAAASAPPSAASSAPGWPATPGPNGITQGYGPGVAAEPPGHGYAHWHAGVDIDVQQGTPLVSPFDGTVIQAGPNGGYGNSVTIKLADGRAMILGHLSRIDVAVGQQVSRGAQLGLSGGTPGTPGAGNSDGPHTHVQINDASGADINPMPVLGANVVAATAGSAPPPSNSAPPPQSGVPEASGQPGDAGSASAPTISAAAPVPETPAPPPQSGVPEASGQPGGQVPIIGGPVTTTAQPPTGGVTTVTLPGGGTAVVQVGPQGLPNPSPYPVIPGDTPGSQPGLPPPLDTPGARPPPPPPPPASVPSSAGTQTPSGNGGYVLPNRGPAPVAPNQTLVHAQVTALLNPTSPQADEYNTAQALAAAVTNGDTATAGRLLASLPPDEYEQVLSLAHTMLQDQAKRSSTDATELETQLDTIAVQAASQSGKNPPSTTKTSGADTSEAQARIDAALNPTGPQSRQEQTAQQVATAIEQGDTKTAQALLSRTAKSDYDAVLSRARAIIKADADKHHTSAQQLQSENDQLTTAAIAAAPAASQLLSPEEIKKKQDAANTPEAKAAAERAQYGPAGAAQVAAAGGSYGAPQGVGFDSSGHMAATGGTSITSSASNALLLPPGDLTYFAEMADLQRQQLDFVGRMTKAMETQLTKDKQRTWTVHNYTVLNGRVMSEEVHFLGGQDQELSDLGMPAGRRA